ncbi:YfhO family protein [Thermoproteota archaeon]
MLSNYKQVVIRRQPDGYDIRLECESDSFLFLSEMHDWGWRAKLDGKELEIVSPFGFFIGAFVPAGKHKVTFFFRPVYFYIFMTMSMATFFSLIGVVFYLRRKKVIF